MDQGKAETAARISRSTAAALTEALSAPAAAATIRNSIAIGIVLMALVISAGCRNPSQEVTVIYCSGNTVDSSGVSVPTYWRDGSRPSFAVLDPTKNGYASSVFVSGSDVHVTGCTENSSGALCATYLKNGSRTELPMLDSTKYGEAFRITVSGSDVYLAGLSTNSSGVWVPAVGRTAAAPTSPFLTPTVLGTPTAFSCPAAMCMWLEKILTALELLCPCCGGMAFELICRCSTPDRMDTHTRFSGRAAMYMSTVLQPTTLESSYLPTGRTTTAPTSR